MYLSAMLARKEGILYLLNCDNESLDKRWKFNVAVLVILTMGL